MTDLPDHDQPETSTDSTTTDDHGAALDRAAGSIREAKDAEGTVSANEDITAADTERAGQNSDNPDGGGGLP